MNKVKIKQKPGSKPELPVGGYAFVVGNGTSRAGKDLKQLTDYGILLACNWFYRKEFRPHVLVCSDEPISQTIQKVDSWYAKTNWFYSWYPKPGSGVKKAPTPEKFAAGAMAAYIAASTYQSKKVFLIGLDFFGFGSKGKDDNGALNNMYANEKHYQKVPEGEQGHAPTYRNWQRRFQWLIQNNPDTEFYHVDPFEGRSPERLIGLKNFHQISFDNLVDHLKNDAELVINYVANEEERALAYEPNPDNERACLERQLVGQENVLFPDMIHPELVLNLRLTSLKNEKKGGRGVSLININGHPLMLPQFGPDASEKFVIADWQREYSVRYTTGGSTPPKQFVVTKPDTMPPVAKKEEFPSLDDLIPPPPPVM